MNHAPTVRKYVMLWDNSVREIDSFLLQDGYLFRLHKLCIPLRPSGILSWEMRIRGLSGHFDQNKTIEVVKHKFYWL